MATTRTPNEIWAEAVDDRRDWPIGRTLVLAIGLSAILWTLILSAVAWAL